MSVNETIERAKFEAKKAKKFINKNKDVIIFAAKIAAIFGTGIYCGVKIRTAAFNKELRATMPDIIVGVGAEGMEAYKDWIITNVPEAMKAIDDKVMPSDDVLPTFLGRAAIKYSFDTLKVDPDKYYKKYRGIHK